MANRSASRTLGLVLCGGESRRMGADKALMTLGGVPLIEYAVKAVRGVADEVRLGTGSAPRYASLGLACVLDAPGGAQAGPLAGLVAGLRAASAAGFDALVVCACDTPRVSSVLLARLLDQLLSGSADIVLLGTHKAGQVHPEPLIGAYRISSLSAAEQALANGQRKMTSFHSGLEVTLVSEHDVPVSEPARNLNTPLDLEAEQLMLHPSAPGAKA